MKRTIIAVAALCVFAAVPATADITISYDHLFVANGILTTPVSGAIVDTFDAERPGWTYGGNWQIVTGTTAGQYAAPWYVDPDPTKYLSVPKTDTQADPEVATVFFGGSKYHYLGLFWGSMDGYNQIKLYDGDILVGTVTGDQATLGSQALGNQGNYLDNAYVNILSTVAFDRIELQSGGSGGTFAFELDNLAVAPVPVPGAFLLGMLGLSVAGVKLRKRA
jgi:hypothetical protein